MDRWIDRQTEREIEIDNGKNKNVDQVWLSVT